MMAELWSDIEQDLAFCRRHLSTAVELFRSPRFEHEDATRYFDEMAFMHMMQSGYTSFEGAMKRLLALLGEEMPKGSDWHADLLRRLRSPVEGARPRILDERLFRAADQVRRFRHVAMHNYDYFDQDRAAPRSERRRNDRERDRTRSRPLPRDDRPGLEYVRRGGCGRSVASRRVGGDERSCEMRGHSRFWRRPWSPTPCSRARLRSRFAR